MRDLLLYAAGILGLVAAFLHGYLGETRVFARAHVEPERLRTRIRLVWHCSVVAWAAVAVLLIAAPAMGSQAARYWIVAAAAVVFGFAAIANAWATRGRFFGWARPDRGCCPGPNRAVRSGSRLPCRTERRC
jgi:hypothetical protein